MNLFPITSGTVTATVTGTQTYGAATAAFQANTVPAGVTVSGNATCTTVNGGQAISPTLPAGSYTIDPSSCSGLTVPAGYTLTYTGGPSPSRKRLRPSASLLPLPEPLRARRH
jgi:hypothetical protein